MAPPRLGQPVNAGLNVLCMKWGTLYGPEYVNRLYRGVQRHLSLPHRFVCLTDDPAGLEPGIDALPLIDVEVPEGEEDLRWRKLAVFSERPHDLEGTALFLDLDLVIVGSLDPFFTHPGRFLIIRNTDLAHPKPLRWLHPSRARRLSRVGNSSVFRFEIGAHPDVLHDFVADPARAIAEQPNEREQEFLSEHMHRRGLLGYWPSGWCVAYKYACVPFFVGSYLRNPSLPSGARIITFAGSLSIPDAIGQRGGRWYRHMRPAEWLAEAWTGKR